MSAQNNIKGLGENYSFYDLKIYEEDTLRSEFGSTWTNPWDSPSREIDVMGLSKSSRQFLETAQSTQDLILNTALL